MFTADRRLGVLLASAVCLLAPVASSLAATLVPIGPPLGNGPSTFWSPRGVSADGTVVVGRSACCGGGVFRWTPGGGAEALAGLQNPALSVLTAVSDDGRTIVGYDVDARLAFQWTAGEGQVFLPGPAPEGLGYRALGVSADGRVVVGGNGSGTRPVAWVDGELRALNVPGDSGWGYAFGVSADGKTIVGTGDYGGGFMGAIRWVDGVPLPLDPGPLAPPSYAVAASPDGSVIVGELPISLEQAFRWSETGGIEPLSVAGPGVIPVPGGFQGRARDVSADGRVIVGSATFVTGFGAQEVAAVWIDGSGPLNLLDLLATQGATGLDGWWLFNVQGISADGRTLIGEGDLCVASGCTSGWVATIDPTAVPGPPAGILLLSAVVAFASRRRGAP